MQKCIITKPCYHERDSASCLDEILDESIENMGINCN